MRNLRKLYVFFFLVVGIPMSYKLQALSPYYGKKLSDSLYADLKSNGIIAEKKRLLPSDTDGFPYNILIPILSSKPKTSYAIDTKDILILSFSQNAIRNHFDSLKNFLLQARKTQYVYDIYILLSPDEYELLPENEETDSVDLFAASLEDANRVCAVSAGFTSDGPSCIIPGSGNDTAPEWLVRRLVKAFSNNRIPVNIQNGNFLSMYRLGILRNDKRLSPFLQNGIPAAGILISEKNETDILPIVFTSFLESYTPNGTDKWDRHYIAGSFAGYHYWIDEPVIVTLYLIVAIVSLFILCGFSFMIGKNRHKNRKDFFKSLYLLPAVLIFSAISLYAGEQIAFQLTPVMSLSPVMQVAVKILFSFFCLIFLFLIEIQMHMAISPYVYSFLQTIMAVANIFIFSAFDLSLFFLFTLEYLVIYILRPAKIFPALLGSLVVMGTPFLPYIVQMFQYGDKNTIHTMIYCSLEGNFLLASGMLPFQIMWLRILARLQIKERKKGQNQLFVAGRIALGVSFSLFFILLTFSVISRLLNRFDLFPDHKPEYGISEQYGKNKPQKVQNIAVSVKDNEYLGLTTRRIFINSKKEAVRYVITVSGNGTVPVYDSVCIFKPESTDGSGLFLLPDWPPQQLMVSYTPVTNIKSTIRVTAYYEQKDSQNGTYIAEETISVVMGKEVDTGGT